MRRSPTRIPSFLDQHGKDVKAAQILNQIAIMHLTKDILDSGNSFGVLASFRQVENDYVPQRNAQQSAKGPRTAVL
jgi:hypothetical protein